MRDQRSAMRNLRLRVRIRRAEHRPGSSACAGVRSSSAALPENSHGMVVASNGWRHEVQFREVQYLDLGWGGAESRPELLEQSRRQHGVQRRGRLLSALAGRGGRRVCALSRGLGACNSRVRRAIYSVPRRQRVTIQSSSQVRLALCRCLPCRNSGSHVLARPVCFYRLWQCVRRRGTSWWLVFALGFCGPE